MFSLFPLLSAAPWRLCTYLLEHELVFPSYRLPGCGFQTFSIFVGVGAAC